MGPKYALDSYIHDIVLRQRLKLHVSWKKSSAVDPSKTHGNKGTALFLYCNVEQVSPGIIRLIRKND